MRVAILTVSDAGARGERTDTSGDAAEQWAVARGYSIADRALVPDETADIINSLTAWCDRDAADLVITTGGTGLSERDVTPEATRAVLERDAPESPSGSGHDDGVVSALGVEPRTQRHS